jgi:hypothetical protein
MKRLPKPWFSAASLGLVGLAFGAIHAGDSITRSTFVPPASGPTRVVGKAFDQAIPLAATEDALPPRRLDELGAPEVSGRTPSVVDPETPGISVPEPETLTDDVVQAAHRGRPRDVGPAPRQLVPSPSAAGLDPATTARAKSVSSPAAVAAPATPPARLVSKSSGPTPLPLRTPAAAPLLAPAPTLTRIEPPAALQPVPIEKPVASNQATDETSTPAVPTTSAATKLPAPVQPVPVEPPTLVPPTLTPPALTAPALTPSPAADALKASPTETNPSKLTPAPAKSAADSGGSNSGNTEPRNVPAVDGPMPAPVPPELVPTPVEVPAPPAPPKADPKSDPKTEPTPEPKSEPKPDSATPPVPAKPEGTDSPATPAQPKPTQPKPTQPPGDESKPAAPTLTPPAAEAPPVPTEEGAKPVAKPEPPPRDPLLNLVDQAIAVTSQRQLRAGVNSPWQIVHGVVALRWDMKIQSEDGTRSLSAVEWLMGGNKFDGQHLWLATQWGGRGHPFTRPYAHEGHPTQFLGYMTMANIPLDYEIQADTKVITVRDIINDAKAQVRQGPEVTWTLWALAHYEDSDAQWYNNIGEPWSMERLLKLQIDEQVTRGACGGCHGLFALCYARNIYITTTGKPLTGVWLEADQKIRWYTEASRTMQNRDGSFSSNFYKGPGFSSDFSTRLNTTGHQLEWIMVSLPNRRLKEQWVRSAVECLARDLIVNARNPSDTGPMYHSLHSLILYRQRLDPNYLIPKRNSPLKLAERNRPQQLVKQPGPQQSATLPQTITPQSAEVEAPAQPAAQPAAQSATQTQAQTPSQPAAKVSVAPRPVPLTTGAADAVDGRDTIVE